MNVKEGIGRFDLNFPFASTDKLQQLYANLNSSTGGLKSLFDGMGKNMQKGDQDEAGKEKGMPQIASVYDITVRDGLYSRKVNQARYEEFTQAMKIDELKQVTGMMGAMDYTLAITLPRPVKNVSNNKALVSTDKKTVTLKTDLLETFQHLELLALDIAY